jgi:hypothetical protein
MSTRAATRRARRALDLRMSNQRRTALAPAAVHYAPSDDGVGLPGDGSFWDYVAAVNPWALQFEHSGKLCHVLQRVADSHDPALGWVYRAGDGPNWRRVAVIMPPRYLKTEFCSRLFPGYLLRRFGRFKVGVTSYGANLARDIAEEAREYFEASGGVLDASTSAKQHWKTGTGGELWSRGLHSGTIGLGFHQGIMDDPQDPDHAHSPAYQERFERWLPAKFLSREEPGAAVPLVMQRLGDGDAFDHLMQREAESPMHWHVVVFDEVKSDEPIGSWGSGPMGLPKTCTVEPDWRAVGEVLAPTRFSAADVARKQKQAGAYVAAVQRQQRAGAVEGDFWREDWIGTYTDLPALAHERAFDWDTAYTAKTHNSASAFVESYLGPPGPDGLPVHIYVHDCGWSWEEAPMLEYWMGGRKPNPPEDDEELEVFLETLAQLGQHPGPHYVEDKASGKTLVQNLRNQNVPAYAVPVHKGDDKFERSILAQPYVAGGRVLVRAAIREKFLRGAKQGILRVRRSSLVTGKGYLDLNDCFVQMVLRRAGMTGFSGGALFTVRPGMDGSVPYDPESVGARAKPAEPDDVPGYVPASLTSFRR